MRFSGFMAPGKKPHLKGVLSVRRFLLIALISLLGVLLVISFFKTKSISIPASVDDDVQVQLNSSYHHVRRHQIVRRTPLSIRLEKMNQLAPRNADLYPTLPPDRTVIVLYVHNRPDYLRLVIDSLSRVAGVNETLLIVSHDGYFEEMNKIVEGIKFCQVKQIFAPYSPHLFPTGFPGACPDDGNPDQYGHFRDPRIVSLKHHWWWMMNAVWDGLEETRRHAGHVLFVEEDHFIFPNAYRSMQALISAKRRKCPDCYAANLAPSDVKSKGEGWESLVAERMGNVGYAFNRSVWRKIHAKAREFCTFDDYNWDITMWATVFPSFGRPVYSLRGPRRSAAHFGKCGLHQGRNDQACIVKGRLQQFEADPIDEVVNINKDWGIHFVKQQDGYKAGFRGWGGWGDSRDHHLCLSFASMYNPLHKLLP